ncbi:ABC transporter ATP-binding protein [Clostridium sp. CF011]|uniref:ABC transporter ATP-binding protein n=1 Tax=Clostridium sp. CF011 TaxID=2843318 RepID=UPI001C0DC127|nr:ABC transporter ATP-binding protein [Clostridium sp. CF011]MBU3090755.1 ABC transporter ATP-binding protein [Clostridium sp. CF011]WAG69531.1 ABC transporter ATP-binding protein [Clostridium sp. CF011]
MNTILEFKNVSYHFQDGSKKTTILKQIGFKFEKGNFYTILGSSGSGKTTFLALASGLDTSKAGEILYEKKNITNIGLTNYRNKYIGIVFQSYNLIPYMSALQNVLTAMEITKNKIENKKQKAYDLLEKMGLTKDEAHRNVLKLSGGQQQRVAIARALSSEGDLIIADEPTGNLDADIASDIVTIFKSLAHRENKCVIVVTHSSEVASQSDVILRLKGGVLVKA